MSKFSCVLGIDSNGVCRVRIVPWVLIAMAFVSASEKFLRAPICHCMWTLSTDLADQTDIRFNNNSGSSVGRSIGRSVGLSVGRPAAGIDRPGRDDDSSVITANQSRQSNKRRDGNFISDYLNLLFQTSATSWCQGCRRLSQSCWPRRRD